MRVLWDWFNSDEHICATGLAIIGSDTCVLRVSRKTIIESILDQPYDGYMRH